MSIPKLLNHKNYMNKSTSANPTTINDMYQFFDNSGTVNENVVAVTLWQPSTTYKAGQVIKSPSMPSGYVARCKTAGTSSDGEPSWHTGDVTDNSVTWTVTKIIMDADKATSAEAKAGTSDKVITASTLKAVLADIGSGSTSSDTYATKKYVDTSITSLSDTYATKSSIPTKVSQLTNDSGYLTTHQDLSSYATKDYVKTALAAIADYDTTAF